jgi:hypothetical protein
MVALDVTNARRAGGCHAAAAIPYGSLVARSDRVRSVGGRDRFSGTAPTFAVLLFASAFFPRLLTAAGAPAVLKFAHFALAAGFLLVAGPRLRARTSRALALGLFLLFFVITLSGFANQAGLINVALDFLLLSEPFILLILLTDEKLPPRQLRWMEWCVHFSAWTTILLSWYQFGVLGHRSDDVKGVFIDEPGAHVNGAVAITYLVYAVVRFAPTRPLLGCVSAVAAISVPVIADTKQGFGVFGLTALLMTLLGLRRVDRVLRYLALTILGTSLLFLLAQTYMPSLAAIMDVDYVREGIEHKLRVFPLTMSYYHSTWNWWLGLGPGHTIGRLGWLIPSYETYLAPLGVTTSPATASLLAASQSHWIAGTSMWSFAFSWAGIWGDLGILGTSVIALLWLGVLRKLCAGEASVFIVTSTLILAFVHAWMEEPGYMLFVITLVGLLWQRRTVGTAARARSHAT